MLIKLRIISYCDFVVTELSSYYHAVRIGLIQMGDPVVTLVIRYIINVRHYRGKYIIAHTDDCIGLTSWVIIDSLY